jgi:TRAP-type C4-dicarboxylate transport system substrate-binding protein
MLLGPKDCAGALAVLDLPFLFQSPRQADRVLDGEIGRAILPALYSSTRHRLVLDEGVQGG